MNAEEMKVISCRVRQGIGNRKRKKIQNRRVNAILPNKNGDGSRPGLSSGTGGRAVLPGNQQGKVVRSVVLELEQLREFAERERAEQQGYHNRKAKLAARCTP